jgi:hypothetical protein
VKDAEKFNAIMAQTVADFDGVDVWTETAKDGTKLFGFGCFGMIAGICPTENGDADFDEMCRQLSQVVADDDAIIIFENGHEKLRYVTGYATVITANAVKTVDLQAVAIEAAREALGNPKFTTECEY